MPVNLKRIINQEACYARGFIDYSGSANTLHGTWMRRADRLTDVSPAYTAWKFDYF